MLRLKMKKFLLLPVILATVTFAFGETVPGRVFPVLQGDTILASASSPNVFQIPVVRSGIIEFMVIGSEGPTGGQFAVKLFFVDALQMVKYTIPFDGTLIVFSDPPATLRLVSGRDLKIDIVKPDIEVP